jgi:hypothetical protein
MCSGGQWMTAIMDCQEDMAFDSCKSGIWLPAKDGECCSTCSEGNYNQKF